MNRIGVSRRLTKRHFNWIYTANTCQFKLMTRQNMRTLKLFDKVCSKDIFYTFIRVQIWTLSWIFTQLEIRSWFIWIHLNSDKFFTSFPRSKKYYSRFLWSFWSDVKKYVWTTTPSRWNLSAGDCGWAIFRVLSDLNIGICMFQTTFLWCSNQVGEC